MVTVKNRAKNYFKRASLLIIFFLGGSSLFSYPLIPNSGYRQNALFKQQQKDIAEYYYAIAQKKEIPPLTLYEYEPLPSQTLFQIANMFSVSIESIATLNNLTRPTDVNIKKRIIIPNLPGIFIPVNPPSATWFFILTNTDRAHLPNRQKIMVVQGEDKFPYHFYIGERFSDSERNSFLGSPYLFPARGISERLITSPYGYRTDPFSGSWSFHRGVDYRVPLNTPIYPIERGVVKEVGVNHILGNYIVIDHPSGMESTYGHLNSATVKKNSEITESTVIGYSGNSGASTGPHLHLEVRDNGKLVDPTTYFK